MSGSKRQVPGREAKSRSPSKVAEAAVKSEGHARPGGDVTLTTRITLSRAQAGRLTALAIHEGKNLSALIAEIVEAEPTA